MRTGVRDERGASMIEFILILPFLLLITCFVLDGSGAMQGYMYLNSLSREIARSASGVPDLEVDTFRFPTNLPNAEDATKVVFDRAQLLYLIDKEYGQSRLEDLIIETTNDGTNFIVTVSARYDHLLPLNLGIINLSETMISVTSSIRVLY